MKAEKTETLGRELLEGLKRQGVTVLLREPRRLTEQGKINRRLWNDACFMARVGYCNTGGIDFLVTCQPRMGR